MKSKFLGLIPARGGSKGIPRKNIATLAGKPLIAWTIETALSCDFLDRIIVSTDDTEIAEIALKSGAEVPFIRPSNLASDNASGIDPVFHAIENIPGYDYLVLLQPTSPLRNALDVQNVVEICTLDGAKSCVSVSEATSHPFHCYSINSSKQLEPAMSSLESHVRRQDMPRYYCLNGAIFTAEIQWLMESKSFLRPETRAYVMPPERSIDIDSPIDLAFADFLIQRSRG